MNEDHWSTGGQGAYVKLSKTLSPLEPLKQLIRVRPVRGRHILAAKLNDI